MTSTAIRTKLNIFDIIEDYNQKVSEIPGIFEDLKEQVSRLETKCTTMGVFGGLAFRHTFSHNHLSDLLKSLKMSSWKYVFNELRIKDIAPQTHLKHFEGLLEDPPEFTEESIRSVFKDYVKDPRGMSLQAFAEIFCRLDKFYKSHSNVKVGVKGLPKRIIVSYCGEYQYSGHEQVADVVNALMRYRHQYDKVVTGHNWYNSIAKPGLDYHGLSFKLYKNGNCHIIFDKQALVDTNRALAEYYGEMLPDAYEHTEKPSESKEVSKDLQFYRTPRKTANKALWDTVIKSGETILEPSCGDGAFMDAIVNKVRETNKDPYDWNHVKDVRMMGVEFHAGRCEEARAKGHSVVNDNFLSWETRTRFDHVIMNPPFYGKHYLKHISKAFSLLKPGGCITAILPITAKMNHGEIDKTYEHIRWTDLPVGSFVESGTGINTVVVRIYK